MKFLLRWGPALVLMAVIFFFSSQPSSRLPDYGSLTNLAHKIAHLFEYALLGLALLRGLGRSDRTGYLLALALVVLYAASDEFHQSFVAGRGSKAADVLVDAAGCLVGFALLQGWPWLRRLIFWFPGRSSL